MSLMEFKCWFEGFTESIEGAPTEKQFERIKAKVKELAPEAKLTYRQKDGRDPIWEAIGRGPVATLGPHAA
ncbi:hypothetical protein [Devosia sp. DBB001]|nr:hypothetical protein [Devosia sp. DBB001]